MENVYVINLDIHTDRMDACREEFDKVGIKEYTRISGVVWNNGKTLKDREMGCKLSHYQIIKEAKEKNLDYITVFEDDIVFTDNFIERIKLFNNYSGWALFYFGANTQYNRGNLPVGDDKFIVYAKYCKTTHAYCMSNIAYDFALTAIEANKEFPIDAIYYGGLQRQFTCYCFYPAIVTQRTGMSYIQNKNRDYSEWIK